MELILIMFEKLMCLYKCVYVSIILNISQNQINISIYFINILLYEYICKSVLLKKKNKITLN